MKYLLRYEIKTKYMGFHKLHYIEFNNLKNIYQFVLENKISNYIIYKNISSNRSVS